MKYLNGSVLILLVLTLLSIVPNAFAQMQNEDVVYLKDGTIVRGTIIEQIPNVSLKIKLKGGSVFVYEYEKIEKITKEPIEKVSYSDTHITSEKSPAVAFILSFLIPGVGQYYNGTKQEINRGIAQEVIYVGGIVMLYSSEDENVVALGAVGALGGFLWSIIDAPIAASNINKELRRQQYGHLIQFDRRNYAVGLDVYPMMTDKGIAAELTIHF